MVIGALQLEIRNGESVKERITRVKTFFEHIDKNRIPDLIILPEIWECGFFNFSDYHASARKLDSELIEWMCRKASELRCLIHMGSIIEEDEGKFYNTSILIDKKGKIIGKYQKIHLFGYESQEQSMLTRGERPVVVSTEYGNIGLATCYDLRFPEQFRYMADQKADIFLITSAWPYARLNHWRLFNQVRALENQCFLFSCNCANSEDGSNFAGHSMGVAPYGEIIAEAGEKEEFLFYEAELKEISQYRNDFPALADRVKI